MSQRGSIRQRGTSWTAYWTVRDEQGSRVQKTRGGFATKRAAQEHLTEVLHQVQRGTWSEPKRVTVPEGELRVTFRDGKLCGVQLDSAEPLTATALRRFPWSRWLTIADAAARLPRYTRQLTARDRAAMAAVASDGRPWSTTHGDRLYQSIATRYAQLVSEGTTNPVAVIAREQKQNHNTVKGWVSKARQRGHLPPARPGRVG